MVKKANGGERDKGVKVRIGERIVRKLGLGYQIKRGLRVELEGGAGHNRVTVHGIRTICECREDSVVLEGDGGWLIFTGERLICHSFSTGGLEISGNITDMRISQGRMPG